MAVLRKGCRENSQIGNAGPTWPVGMLRVKVPERFSEGGEAAFRAWIERCATSGPDGVGTDDRPSRTAQKAAYQLAIEEQIQSPGENPDQTSVNQFDLNGH